MSLTSNHTPTQVQTIPITACTHCRFRSSTSAASCPLCGEATEQREVAAIGTVWSHTLVHLPHGTNTNGYRLVYVDLDDGPRILCQQGPEETPVNVDDRVLIGPGSEDTYLIKEVTP
jgi:uncharacterized OB-fold protein